MTGIDRRRFLRGTAGVAAAGALLVAGQRGVLAQTIGGIDAYGTSRRSRLFPDGPRLAHLDMHNHTLFSDGAGNPGDAFASMRAAGLDVAALTDHSTIQDGLELDVCAGSPAPAEGESDPCQSFAGISEVSWQETAGIADAGNRPGAFTAIRGFEWSSPTLGHMNVWFTQEFTDPLHTAGLGTPQDLVRFAAIEAQGQDDLPEGLRTLFEPLLQDATTADDVGMSLFYEWLKLPPDTPLAGAGLDGVAGGGADGIFGFNHPGREPIRFSEFQFDEALVDRCVSLELFNRNDDYLFELVPSGQDSPLVACLDKGWRTGLLGVTDEHGTDWGFPDGKGRAGAYVDELTRDGVREAMVARRFFATNLKGLRLDAAADGVRMGGTLAPGAGPVTIELDLDRGPDWVGTEVVVQVLATGSPLPTILVQGTLRAPGPDEPLLRLEVPVDVAEDGTWLVVRVCDPARDADGRAAATPFAAAGGAIAYASPFFLDPDAAPGPGPISGQPDPAASPSPDGTPPDADQGSDPGGTPPGSEAGDDPAGAPDEPVGTPSDDSRDDAVDGRTLPTTGASGVAVGAAAIAAAAALRRRGRGTAPDGGG